MKKTFRISVNGKSFDVVAEMLDDGGQPMQMAAPRSAGAARAARAAAPAAAAPSSAPIAAADGDVPSPLAGKVVSIDAPVGTAVKVGDQVITLEAMKMNTVVSSPVDGTVKAVHVQPGDGVEEGQPLLTIA